MFWMYGKTKNTTQRFETVLNDVINFVVMVGQIRNVEIQLNMNKGRGKAGGEKSIHPLFFCLYVQNRVDFNFFLSFNRNCVRYMNKMLCIELEKYFAHDFHRA